MFNRSVTPNCFPPTQFRVLDADHGSCEAIALSKTHVALLGTNQILFLWDLLKPYYPQRVTFEQIKGDKTRDRATKLAISEHFLAVSSGGRTWVQELRDIKQNWVIALDGEDAVEQIRLREDAEFIGSVVEVVTRSRTRIDIVKMTYTCANTESGSRVSSSQIPANKTTPRSSNTNQSFPKLKKLFPKASVTPGSHLGDYNSKTSGDDSPVYLDVQFCPGSSTRLLVTTICQNNLPGEKAPTRRITSIDFSRDLKEVTEHTLAVTDSDTLYSSPEGGILYTNGKDYTISDLMENRPVAILVSQSRWFETGCFLYLGPSKLAVACAGHLPRLEFVIWDAIEKIQLVFTWDGVTDPKYSTYTFPQLVASETRIAAIRNDGSEKGSASLVWSLAEIDKNTHGLPDLTLVRTFPEQKPTHRVRSAFDADSDKREGSDKPETKVEYDTVICESPDEIDLDGAKEDIAIDRIQEESKESGRTEDLASDGTDTSDSNSDRTNTSNSNSDSDGTDASDSDSDSDGTDASDSDSDSDGTDASNSDSESDAENESTGGEAASLDEIEASDSEDGEIAVMGKNRGVVESSETLGYSYPYYAPTQRICVNSSSSSETGEIEQVKVGPGRRASAPQFHFRTSGPASCR